MSERIDPEERRTAIALFRYTLILPLLRDEFEPGGKGRLREQIAAGYHEIPYSTRRSVSVPTLARWERQYKQDGFDGLKPKPRDDRGQPRTISPETLDRAEALKRQQPHRSSRSIVQALSMDTTQPIPEETIAPRTLRRQLALRDATTAQLLAEQRPKPYRRFERTHFGDLWQGDAMHGPMLPDPAHPGKERQVFLFAFLDDHTRLVPHAQFYWNEQLPRLEDCFKRAMLRYGRPLSIYVDQGKVYISKQLDTICATLGIQRILGTPYYPEGRGKIERFFQFVQSDFLPELATSAVDTLPLLNESLLAWLEVVYHTKVHTETGQAPLERYRQDETPSTRPVDPTELRQAFAPSRPAQGHQDRHLLLQEQPLPRRRLPARPDHRAALRPLRPQPPRGLVPEHLSADRRTRPSRHHRPSRRRARPGPRRPARRRDSTIWPCCAPSANACSASSSRAFSSNSPPSHAQDEEETDDQS